MEGPNFRPARRLSSGVVVVRPESCDFRFLMLRAFRHWDFPKGMVEPGEEAFDAAVREVREETTLTDLAFDWGHSFLETGPYNRGKVARYYLAANRTGAVSLPVNPELGRPEHNEFRWVDYREALSLVSPRLVPVLNWAGHILRIEFN
jgi:bis(5'-nucleosidyl)-tetraphosphatase